MGKRTSYPPGTFSWVDLVTADPAAATAFYTGVLGWEAGDVAGRTTFRLDGDAVCGLAPVGAAGAPSTWRSHVTVADVEAAAARATELGGRVVERPADAPGPGRTAVLEDPLGAAFAVSEPRGRIGAERVNDPGCLCINEYVTADLRRARAFYEALFGWTTEPFVDGPDGPEMLLALNGGRVNASLIAGPAGTPPHWRACFAVESTEEAVGSVRDLGGRTLAEPSAIPDGSLAVVADPQGAVFSLFAGPVDD